MSLQQTKKNRDAAFFHEIEDDTYICNISKEKVLHPAFHELTVMQPFIGILLRRPQFSIVFLFVRCRLAPLSKQTLCIFSQ